MIAGARAVGRGLDFLDGVAPDNVFTATFVHDALDPALYDALGRGETVAAIRSRFREFVCGHREADGTWRFFGRGSPMDADADTTSCAAVVCATGGDAAAYVDAVRRFEDAEGLFPSYVDARGHRYSWILDGGIPLTGVDRVVQANVARFFASAGRSCPAIWTFLGREVRGGAFASGSPDYPNPLTFFYMVARAYSALATPPDPVLAERLVDHLLPRLRDAERGGRPLSAALALLAWLYVKGPRDTARPLAGALASLQEPEGCWAEEPFFVGGYGSAGLSTTLALEALRRFDA